MMDATSASSSAYEVSITTWVAGLSPQERNILPLIAEGKTNREIAEVLVLSERTIKTYVSNILQKLQLSRRSEAAAFSARQRRPT